MNMDTAGLTDEQIDFLAQCEADFANRYTDKDDDFVIVKQIGVSPPPIIEPWRPKGGSNHYRRDRDQRDRGIKRHDDGDTYYRNPKRRREY
ncbi:Hypothetical protein NTJ_08248 [Nesidiocoris tenuis]|uniref:Uncharacterized protein n=1 Tax=Nesidiocoris tenuis TaxID=355587 RepID=A0ABN7ATB0_9HEMI|nr:Hypothetical protein NTJ_08248 [Nesidiocoris tenuis]